MSILTLLLVIIFTGIALWAINKWIPMEATIKKILNVVVILAIVLWLLKAFGVFEALSKAQI